MDIEINPGRLDIPRISSHVHTRVCNVYPWINFREFRLQVSNVAMDSGVFTFTLTEATGKTRQVQARYTFVYEQVGGQWKILNHHSSAMPEAQVQHAAKLPLFQRPYPSGLGVFAIGDAKHSGSRCER